MGNYRLSEEARDDLYRIWLYGLEKWGEVEADKYYMAFFEHFNQIAQQPLMYPSVDHIRKGYRRSRCGVDNIYYRIRVIQLRLWRLLVSKISTNGFKDNSI